MPFQIDIVGLCFCLYLSLFLSCPLLSSFPFLFAFGLRFYYSLIISCKISHNVRYKSQGILFFFFFLFPIFFLGPHLQHLEVPGLGVKLELQLPTYTTVKVTSYWSHICLLRCSSWQCQSQILARD